MQGVRVAVHRVTGEIVILQSVHAADIGRLINPMQCRGQIDGAIAMGFGWALYEKMVYDGNGAMVNPALRNYRIPAFADVPRSEVYFADTYDTHRPAGRQVAGRVRDQSRRAGDRERGGRRDGRALCQPAAVARAHLRPARRRGHERLTGGRTPWPATASRSSPRRGCGPSQAEAFARWQDENSEAIAQFPGLHRADGDAAEPAGRRSTGSSCSASPATRRAVAWLQSEERRQRLRGARPPMLVGHDDVHLVADGGAGVLPAPVSAVISTRIKPGQEAAYRHWEQRIAAAQARAPGFQGYRFEPPVPGVQDDWLAILRFDTGSKPANLARLAGAPERCSRRRTRSPRNSTRASRGPASTNGSRSAPSASPPRRPGSRT